MTHPPFSSEGAAADRAWPERLRRASEILSYVLHPATLMMLTVIFISGQVRHNVLLTLVDAGILMAGLLPGLLYIYVKTRRGDISHYHLVLIAERRIVLPLLCAGMVISFALYALSGAPALMLRDMVVGLLGGVGAILISRFWKISLHSAVAMGCAALLVPLSPTLALGIGMLGILVGVSRLVVKHHTPAQVIVGWLYGFGATSVLVALLRV